MEDTGITVGHFVGQWLYTGRYITQRMQEIDSWLMNRKKREQQEKSRELRRAEKSSEGIRRDRAWAIC